MSDGGQSLLTRENVEVGGVTRVCSGSGGRVYANASSGTAHSFPGELGETSTPTPSTPPLQGETQTYPVFSPAALTRLRFPVAGYQGRATNWTNLQ